MSDASDDGLGGATDLRFANPGDASELASLHVEVWRQTYHDIAPADALSILDEARRLPFWRVVTTASDTDVGAIVASRGDNIVGVVSFGHPTHRAFDGMAEITHLYVRESARGLGLGRTLLMAGLNHLRRRGCEAAGLAVVKQNEDARRFYRTCGGIETGTFQDQGPLWRSENILVQWTLSEQMN